MNIKSLNRNIFLWVFILILVAIDQITKFWVRKYLATKAMDVILINRVLVFHYLENRGAAWGIFQGRYNILSFVSIILIVLFVILLCKIPEDKKYSLLRATTVFIIAGAIGNLIDRLFFGYVTDFIYFEIINFPVFNVADIYVTCSVFFLVYLMLFYYKDEDLAFIPFFASKKESDSKIEQDNVKDES